MDPMFAPPNITKIYANIEKQVLLEEIKKWDVSDRNFEINTFRNRKFKVSDNTQSKISKLFQQQIESVEIHALNSSIFDKNLAQEIGQFHCPKSYHKEIPMTAYRLRKREDCQKEIIKKIIQNFVNERVANINQNMQDKYDNQNNDKNLVVFTLSGCRYLKLLNTTGLGKANEATFTNMLCKALTELYDLKKCDLQIADANNANSNFKFTFYFK